MSRSHALQPRGDEAFVGLPPTVRAPREARQAVGMFLSEVASPGVVEDAQLLVSELVTNSLHHAALGPGDSIGLKISVRAASSVARVEVSDPGPGFARDASAAPLTALRGRGLHLVHEIATRWGVSDGAGTVVWFEVSMHPTEQDSLTA